MSETGAFHPRAAKIVTSKTFLNLFDKDHCKVALDAAGPPKFKEMEDMYKGDFPNTITLLTHMRIRPALSRGQFQ